MECRTSTDLIFRKISRSIFRKISDSIPNSGPVVPVTGAILLEDGASYLLTENGFKLLLE